MVREQWTRDAAAEARSAKVKAAQAVLAEAVDGLRSGHDWARFLDFQSQLYDYSANNVLLLAVQHQKLYVEGKVPTPVPSYVASYSKWKQLGRQVEKGQRGLAIIAPMRGLSRVATDEDGKVLRVLRRDETPEPGEHEARTPWMRGFTVEKVFSAEQTTGDPIPEPPAPRLLAGEAPRGLGEAVMKLIEARGFTVSTAPAASYLQGANGLTTFPAKTVQVRADMDDAAMVKTLIHEAAHVLLHNPGEDADTAPLPRAHAEVEAESVAFIVARVHGLPTDGYSFPFIAAWAGQDPGRVIATTAQRVAAAAKDIIAASPAEHTPGGKAALRLTVPDTVTTVSAAPEHRAAAAVAGIGGERWRSTGSSRRSTRRLATTTATRRVTGSRPSHLGRGRWARSCSPSTPMTRRPRSRRCGRSATASPTTGAAGAGRLTCGRCRPGTCWRCSHPAPPADAARRHLRGRGHRLRPRPGPGPLGVVPLDGCPATSRPAANRPGPSVHVPPPDGTPSREARP